MPWPVYVPYLSEENICKRNYTDRRKDDCHDAWYWLCQLFVCESPEWNRAVRLIFNILEDDETFYDPEEVGTSTALILWGTSNQNPPKYIARTLNKLFLKLGYTEYEYLAEEEAIDLCSGRRIPKSKGSPQKRKRRRSRR